MSVVLKKNVNKFDHVASRKVVMKRAAHPEEQIIQTEDIKVDGMKILLGARKRLPGIKAAMAKLKPEDRYEEMSYGSSVGKKYGELCPV